MSHPDTTNDPEATDEQVDDREMTDEVPDVSHSSGDDGKDVIESHKRANEMFNRLIDGRSAASGIVLSTPYGELPCDIDLSKLDMKTRWDCVKALPDGMFRATAEADGELDERDIELEADIVPDGEGMVMMREVVLATVSTEHLSDGDFASLVENDLPDDYLIEMGMRILEMSLDRGQITGFRFTQ